MKRGSVLRGFCAMIGMSLSLFGCRADTNPVMPLGGPNADGGGPSERYLAPLPDGGGLASGDAIKDARDASDTDATAVDSVPAALVKVMILGLASDNAFDGGAADGGTLAASADGGASAAMVVDKSRRFAPSVRVEVQSVGGDPMADVVSSVKASLLTASGTSSLASVTLNQTQFGVGTGPDSKFFLFTDTPLDVSKVAADFYQLQVVATTAGGAVGTASVRFYLDGGPSINFLQPADKAYVKGSTTVTVVVTDKHSQVDTVGISIGQNTIDPSQVLNKGGQYSVTIDFGAYTPPLDGDQVVTVTALNSAGVTSISIRKITIDNVGPKFSSTRPEKGTLIGKLITIEAKVEDPAGVMDNSVTAVVAHGDIHFETKLVRGADGTYRQIFDASQLPDYAIFPTISFRAQDMLGNQASVGYIVDFDTTPPIMDLDPPDDFRVYKKDGTCSWPFDPVGPDAIDDGSIVSQLFDIRARVEDRGNTPIGYVDWVPIAMVDPASVYVLLLDDTSLPLVVDTSDPPDGFCDEINPDIIPSVSPKSSKEVQKVELVPLGANTGTGDFSPEPGVTCKGNESQRPEAVCETTYSYLKQKSLTYYLAYSGNDLPAIYTLAPVNNNRLQCVGPQFDASNHLTDGWACAAVEASDLMGNKQVSRPLRICVAATAGSTACTSAAIGGADITSVTLPSSAAGDVSITTRTALLGNGNTAIKRGDSVILTMVSPTPFANINGTHTVTPQGSLGTSFVLDDLSLAPAQLWIDNLDGKAPILKGSVGLIAQNGTELQVVTDHADTSLAADFAGRVIVLNNGNAPEDREIRWNFHSLTPAGFKLSGSSVQLTGMAVAPSKLPNCTGTATKKASGDLPVVDASKPCVPLRSFARHGGWVVN